MRTEPPQHDHEVPEMEHIRVHFTVTECAVDGTTPDCVFLSFEARDKESDFAGTVDRMTLWLKPGATYEDARELANVLNQRIPRPGSSPSTRSICPAAATKRREVITMSKTKYEELCSVLAEWQQVVDDYDQASITTASEFFRGLSGLPRDRGNRTFDGFPTPEERRILIAPLVDVLEVGRGAAGVADEQLGAPRPGGWPSLL